MDFDEYQRQATETDQNPSSEDSGSTSKSEVIPLLGLVGEVGGLLAEYKKLLRDGPSHRTFRDEVSEELGDILWYVSNVASKQGLSLSQIARDNLKKTADRFKTPTSRAAHYDADQPAPSRLPRRFRYEFGHEERDGDGRLVLTDLDDGTCIGDPLSDNAYSDDGYRYHDVFHLTLAARFGWSPVYRKLLRRASKVENRVPNELDDAEDGGRAQVVDEALAIVSYVHARRTGFFQKVSSVDWKLLRHIKDLTSDLEVRDRTMKEWNDAIIIAFKIWEQLKDNKGGVVSGDLDSGEVSYAPTSES